MYVSIKLLVLAAFGHLSSVSAASTSKCPVTKTVVNGYPNPGCVVLSVADAGVRLASTLFLVNGDCKNTNQLTVSFRHAITNDAQSPSCRLTAWSGSGCTGTGVDMPPHVEDQFNLCVNYGLTSTGTLSGANSFSLKCS